MVDFRVIIPVRYDSHDFAGKALANINGKPMLQYVYENAKASGAEDVCIATDDNRIAQVASDFGAYVYITANDHRSGTERLAETVVALGLEADEIVVCLQADQPLLPPKIIRRLAENLDAHQNVRVASVCVPIENSEELFSPGITKVVLNHRNHALYFSRAPIPWQRHEFEKEQIAELNGSHYRHIGIYAYRVGFLDDYMSWEPCKAECTESLEQLRILWYGARMHMLISDIDCPLGVETQGDLERVRSQMLA